MTARNGDLMRVAALTGIGVAGTGRSVADGGRRVDNDEVHSVLRENGGRPVSSAWLERNGFESRVWTAVPGRGSIPGAPSTEDLLTDAAAAALDDAGIGAAEVDVLVAATTTPSRLTSSMATVVGGRLGTTRMAVELRAGCPSALHGIVVAAAQLAAGASVAVVTAAETLSRVAPGTGPLAYAAGDGAGAVVLTRNGDTGRGVIGGVLGSDGRLADSVGVPGPLPPTSADVAADRFRLRFADGYDDAAMQRWRTIGADALASCAVSPDDIDAVIANQAGRDRLAAATAGAGVAPPTLVDVVGSTANAGSASFMIALDEARRRGRERVDDGSGPSRWLMLAVGGGLSYGAVVISP